MYAIVKLPDNRQFLAPRFMQMKIPNFWRACVFPNMWQSSVEFRFATSVWTSWL